MRQIKNKDYLSQAEAEIWAELGNSPAETETGTEPGNYIVTTHSDRLIIHIWATPWHSQHL